MAGTSFIAVSALEAEGGPGQIVLQWQAADPTDLRSLAYMQLDKFEIWSAASNWTNIASATKAGESEIERFVHAGLAPGALRFYRVRARDNSGNLGEFYPPFSSPAEQAMALQKLSDISQDLGDIIAGNITGTRIRTSVTGARVEIAFADNSLKFYNRSGVLKGEISFDRSSGQSMFYFDLADGGLDGAFFRNDPGVAVFGRNNATYASVLGENYHRSGIAGGFFNQANGSSGKVRLGVGDLAGGWGVEAIGGAGMKTTALEASSQVLCSVLSTNKVNVGASFEIFSGGFLDSPAGAVFGGNVTAASFTPFTGAHHALINEDVRADIGDILCDVRTIKRQDVNNALTVVRPSGEPKERNVIGVLSLREPLIHQLYVDIPWFYLDHLRLTKDFALVNGVGEGLINVCGLGGDLEAGDFICTSEMPGKGMRQNDADGEADDIPRRCTVARSREAVSFDYPNQIKCVAAIYLCG